MTTRKKRLLTEHDFNAYLNLQSYNLPPKEIARILKVSDSTIYAWIRFVTWAGYQEFLKEKLERAKNRQSTITFTDAEINEPSVLQDIRRELINLNSNVEQLIEKIPQVKKRFLK